MTFLAILVWLLIVAGTAYMLKTLIFTRDLSAGKECCSMASGGMTGDEGPAAKDFTSDVVGGGETAREEETPQEEKIEEVKEKSSEGEEK
ncbi:MAG: hypothetical protein GX751_12400 [Desulfuromonadaceae bacterium]|nr:hypothetical protein [Desulfuromonadaceae bacterium]